jgi:DNA-binding PadR family transcriptional regulator
MYYELVVLGRLMYAPYHGYLIMHVISEMLGPWQKVSPGTLYPLLARLEQDGLIQSAPAADGSNHGRRTAKVYAISEAGRARFRELMLDLVSSIGEYQRLFALKVPHLEFLSADEQLQILEHYRDYCRMALRHQERVTRELEERRDTAASQEVAELDGATRQGITHGLLVTRHLQASWQLELRWVDELVDHVTTRRR